MKTLSSRAADCNSTTLARLADGLVRLRVKSPETQEVLQELAEVQGFFSCFLLLCFIGGYLGWGWRGLGNCGVWWPGLVITRGFFESALLRLFGGTS